MMPATKFQNFLHAERTETFGEHLCGIRLPKVELVRGRFGDPWRYRMYRLGAGSYGNGREVEGQWASTKKAAKASYKQALSYFRSTKERNNAGESHD